MNRMFNLVHSLAVQFLRGTPFIVWWYRLLGAKIGRCVETCQFIDSCQRYSVSQPCIHS